jgi:hypothetical protein
MKELAEIERGYIKDIIEFFCRKSFEVFGKNFKNQINSHDTISWIENKIRKRLLEPGMINDYRIVINFNDIAKNRDYRIDQVLGNDSVKPKNNIEVSVRYGNRDFETFEYEIT